MYVTAYSVQYSTDNSTWSDAASESGSQFDGNTGQSEKVCG